MALAKPKHDPFFSRSLEHPALAKDFFRAHTPAYLKPFVHFDSFTRTDRTNTDPKLEQRRRDIIYKAAMKVNHTLFACSEHQSTPDWNILMRFLRYDLDALDTYLAQHKKWPLIINLLLYHGKQSPYPYPTEASEYYEQPLWGAKELFVRFYVIDLTQMSDAVILSHGLCAPLEVLLKHSREGKFELRAASYQEVFERCIKELGDEYLITMLTYATGLNNQEVGKRMFGFIEEILKDKKEVIVTYAQQLRKEGMQQGIQTRNVEIAKNMLLQLGLDMDIVHKATGLSQQELEKLKKDTAKN